MVCQIWEEGVTEMKKSSIFGKKIAKIMLELSSSHVFFIIQQTYKGKKWGKDGELMSWENVVEILKEIIKEK